jgi:hypothetical protein
MYSQICSEPIDMNTYRHVGWKDTNPCLQKYYSRDTINLISRKVTELTLGVDPKNRKIIVPDNIIRNVLDSVYTSISYSNLNTGDIFTRYNIPKDTQQSVIQSMIDQTVEIIYNNVVNQYAMDQNNNKLSIYTTILGDFNTHSLRSHPIIKIRERRPATMQFNMNY